MFSCQKPPTAVLLSLILRDIKCFLRMSSQLPADPVLDGFPWCFRGEGNSSLVLASQRTGMVLRLRKVPFVNPEIKAADNHQQHSLEGIVSYAQSVVKPMVACGSWVPKMKVLTIHDRFEELLKTIKPERHPHRLHNGHVFHADALLMRDLSFLPSDSGAVSDMMTLSVELKPKEGILPTDESAHPIRKRFSKYKLKQLMKVKEKTILSKNDFDPLDLFSGEPFRMKTALRHLVSNPQNNFRVFTDGTLKFGANNTGHDSLLPIVQPFLKSHSGVSGSWLDEFLDLLISALLQPWSSPDHFGSSGPHPVSVLGSLLNAQQQNTVDIEPLYPQYVYVARLFEERRELRAALGVDGPNYDDAPFWTGLGMEKFSLSDYEVTALRNLRDYLASATLKDCSVFLSFQLVTSDVVEHSVLPVIRLSNGLSFRFHASLVDLDPKPFERIEKHFFECQKLIEIATQLGIGK